MGTDGDVPASVVPCSRLLSWVYLRSAVPNGSRRMLTQPRAGRAIVSTARYATTLRVSLQDVGGPASRAVSLRRIVASSLENTARGHGPRSVPTLRRCLARCVTATGEQFREHHSCSNWRPPPTSIGLVRTAVAPI